MFRNSIRVQLLAGLLIPLAAVAVIQLSIAYQSAGATAQAVNDRLLLASARSIAEQISFGDAGLESFVPPSALGVFDSGHNDTVYYSVRTDDGRLLAGYPDLSVPYPSEPTDQPRYFDLHFRDAAVRAVAVTQVIPSPTKTRHGFVVVGETLNGRDAMRRSLWIENSVQQALLVLVALMVAWIVLRGALNPLLRLSQEVEMRRPDEYRPFAITALQTELRPFVVALNGYMLRLQRQMDAQRRFTANAAHQMRTPLTLLRTQASYALRAAQESERLEAVRAILATTGQITRLTNQLLSLAKAEPHGQTPRRDVIDLAAATREILEEHGALAVVREIDLAFDDRAAEPAMIRADPGALRDLVVNVIDNAIRYTPPGGEVLVTVDRDGDACFLRVEDSGPGIPSAERELVFERFYRVREGQSEGSGLGLAIVKEIADSHGARVTLGERDGGHGLVVEVRFPAPHFDAVLLAASTNSVV